MREFGFNYFGIKNYWQEKMMHVKMIIIFKKVAN